MICGRGRHALLALFLTLAAGVAGAGEVAPMSPLHAGTATGRDCTCRFRGTDFLVGETACIRGVVARCGRVLNNTSWEFSQQSCPMAARPVAGAPRG